VTGTIIAVDYIGNGVSVTDGWVSEGVYFEVFGGDGGPFIFSLVNGQLTLPSFHEGFLAKTTDSGSDGGIESIAGDWHWYNPEDPDDIGSKIVIASDGKFTWNSYSGGEHYPFAEGAVSLININVTFTFTAFWIRINQ